MRRVVLWTVVVSSFACGDGLRSDLRVVGELSGKQVDMRLALTTGGGNVTDGSLGVAPSSNQLAIIGGTADWSSVSGTCPTSPCPDTATLTLSTPPPLIYAGRFPVLGGFGLSADGKAVASHVFPAGAATLDFGEPTSSASGKVVMLQRATMVPAEGALLKVSGTVDLEFHCDPKNSTAKYFRYCGELRGKDGESNPRKLPYAENACPPELVAPYEASPTWNGTTLSLGDIRADCRNPGGSTADDGKTPVLLCYSKRSGVKAAGCTWTVHFVTDGELYQFAIAGFADAACPTRTCNTYR